MTQSLPKILMVDDRPENLLVLERLLSQLDVELVQTTSSIKALALTLEHDFFVAIVDVQMPEMDGYELVELLRGNESTASLPVIFVSAIYSDEYHHRKAYDAGAVDFLSKPFIPEVLISKVKVFLDLYRQRQQLEALVSQLNTANQELSKFAVQLETGARVSHQITSILDLDRLLYEVVDLIREGFDCYFVGVWLMAKDQDAVVLEANSQRLGSSELGQSFSIPLDAQKSIIAHVCRSTTMYLADDVTLDDYYLPTDALPDTASELVLPLNVGSSLLGALDIQSEQTAAFKTESISALQILADQIAIAIRNARLYADVLRFNTELEDRVRERTAELERAYHQLELLDRNKSEFIQIVSHELRTPLTLIKGFSQILLKDQQKRDNPEYLLQTEGIVKGASRMQEVVNSMLDIIKIDSSTLELIPEWLILPDLLASLCHTFRETLTERRLDLTLDAMPDLPEIYADPDALNKLFSHLLLNAIKYTPDGGSITLAGRYLPTDNHEPHSGFVEIIVSDTGIGIDPQVQDLIFTKFYQTGPVALHSSGKTKFKGGGTGLGLPVARGIVEAHGGKIWVESPGYDEDICPGSQFHVVLPVKKELTSQTEVTERLTTLQRSSG